MADEPVIVERRKVRIEYTIEPPPSGPVRSDMDAAAIQAAVLEVLRRVGLGRAAL